MSATKDILLKIFNNLAEDLALFNDLEVLEIYEKGTGKFYLKSLSKDESERLVYNETTQKSAPEEIVRQLYLYKLIKHYKYPKNIIEIEKSVKFGRETKKADVVVFRNDEINPKIIV